MDTLCKEQFYPYRLVRVGEEIFIASDLHTFHRDLINKIWGTDIEDSLEIKTRLHNDSNRGDIDMANVSRYQHEYEVAGSSTQLDWPPEDLMPQIRKKTFEVMRLKYPGYIFKD